MAPRPRSGVQFTFGAPCCFRRSTALAIVVIQPTTSTSASGDVAIHGYQLALSQWVELQHPPSAGALAFGGEDGSTLFVGAIGDEAPAVFSRQNGAFLSVA